MEREGEKSFHLSLALPRPLFPLTAHSQRERETSGISKQIAEVEEEGSLIHMPHATVKWRQNVKPRVF